MFFTFFGVFPSRFSMDFLAFRFCISASTATIDTYYFSLPHIFYDNEEHKYANNYINSRIFWAHHKYKLEKKWKKGRKRKNHTHTSKQQKRTTEYPFYLNALILYDDNDDHMSVRELAHSFTQMLMFIFQFQFWLAAVAMKFTARGSFLK